MKTRRVVTLRLALSHELQVGFLVQPRPRQSGSTTPRWRWWVAERVDHLPGQCWSGLVHWAMGLDHEDLPLVDRLRLPWRTQVASCEDSARDYGGCYCSKVMRADVLAEIPVEHHPRYSRVVPA